jgi:octanoyl-[GcvH]:protein N-octanoyltransferase
MPGRAGPDAPGSGRRSILTGVSSRPLQIVRDSFPQRPAFDTAVSRAILLRVSRGELPETMRLGRPGAMVAFGRRDVASGGYGAAVQAARAGGFEAVERLAGGRAAVFHEQTVALAHATADRQPTARTRVRFDEMAELVAESLRVLGIDAHVGEIAGEYCPGEHSVNAGGRTKLAGIGQRLVKGAAHVGGVVVVGGSDRVREVLVPVYRALSLAWDPATAGSVADELGSADQETVVEAILEQLVLRHDLEQVRLDRETLALAEQLEPLHRSPAV